MTITKIIEQSNLKPEVAESLYYKSIWLRNTSSEHIKWAQLLNNKEYRMTGNESKRHKK